MYSPVKTWQLLAAGFYENWALLPSETVRKRGDGSSSLVGSALPSARWFFNFRTAPDFSQVGEKVGLRHFIYVPPECLSPPYTVAWSFSFSAFWLKSLGKSAAAAVEESSDIIERRQKTNIGFHSRSPRAAGSDRSYIDDKSSTLDGEHHLSLMRAR
jgi:hypothetical protein